MKNKFLIAILGGTLVLALVAGAAAFLAIRSAQAQEDLANQELRSVFGPAGFNDSQDPDVAHRQPGRFPGDKSAGTPGMRGEDQTYLAEALGISVEELQAAHQAAWEKGLAELVAAGEITQAQADRLKEFGVGKLGHYARMGGWMLPETSLNYDTLLAEELGINIDDLNAARDKAKDLALQAAVDSGKITQEQAIMIKAREALQPYLDRETLTATALSMSVEELQAAREAGTSLQDLLADKGLNAVDFQRSLLDAYQTAIEQAVQDGVITQAQADEFLNRGVMGGWCMPGMDGRKHGGPNNFRNQPDTIEPESDL